MVKKSAALAALRIRKFNESDWNAFAGAESWTDGNPLFLEGKFTDNTEFVIVLDKNGGCLMVEDNPINDEGGYQLTFKLATQEAGLTFAGGLRLRLMTKIKTTLQYLLNTGLFQEQE
jgi:hypothetical protein